MMANWQDAAPGVKIWVPASEGEIETTQQSFSRLSVCLDEDHQQGGNSDAIADSTLPLLEENLRIKQAIYNELFHSPGVRAPSIEVKKLDATSPPAAFTLRQSSDSTFLDQLRAYTTPEISTRAAERSSNLNTQQLSYPTTTLDTEYSEATDFLETEPTPCPQRKLGRPRKQTGVTSHYFRNTGNLKARRPVRRILDFGKPTTSSNRSNRTSKTMAIAPEYSPSHRWTTEEREFLCVLNRWFCRCPITFAQIYNVRFGQDLKIAKVRNQFENYMRLHGEKAFPVFRAVFSVPFDDPDNIYNETRRDIETIAKHLDIDLQLLKEEVPSPTGLAQKAKSIKTRKLYRQLVRKASREGKAPAVQSPRVDTVRSTLPTMGSMTIGASNETAEILCDTEDSSQLRPMKDVELVETTSTNSITEPTLGFRVWSTTSSRTRFTEQDGFISEAFASVWKGELPPPFSREGEGAQAIKLLTNWHLSMSGGGASAWVSVSVSLLQALTKACSMDRPQIALINLAHPTLTVPNKTLKAAEVLSSLKADGQAWWARYKGHAERLVWANIPASAVIQSFSLADLIDLSDSCITTGNLLQLPEFVAGRRTQSIAAILRERNVTLDTSTAQALGKISKQFGLDDVHVELSHVRDFLSCMVDSWYINYDLGTGTRPPATMASIFANALCSRGHHKEDIMNAFIDGVEQGTRTIAFYARKRRPVARRVRTA
ncbi:hypothetical protein FB567DRAFT_633216 [Paraphoma chrysanthemicola]|uniref:DUF7587 domain-containing protein n=1 Tax=Paraphoma chrysanthemicola TaxID=798071 RepID=A0A8K0VU08_9PLEO|nr:hypothetical protein FB567DRAFT_633216 [Paraphoma chrysanthemicola]